MAETLGQRLRALIGDRPITVIADRAGISRQYLDQQLLRDRVKRPSPQTLDALADVLGVTPDYLRKGRDPDEEPVENTAALLSWRNRYHQQEWRHIQNVIDTEVERRMAQYEERPLRVAESRRQPYQLGQRLPVIRLPLADIQKLTKGLVAAGQPIVIVPDDFEPDYLYTGPEYTTHSE